MFRALVGLTSLTPVKWAGPIISDMHTIHKYTFFPLRAVPKPSPIFLLFLRVPNVSRSSSGVWPLTPLIKGCCCGVKRAELLNVSRDRKLAYGSRGPSANGNALFGEESKTLVDPITLFVNFRICGFGEPLEFVFRGLLRAGTRIGSA